MKQEQKTVTIRLRVLAWAGLLCLSLFLWACTKENTEPENSPVRTILFYMGGDNNLTLEAGAKIERLKEVCVPPGCRLVIYADTRGDNPRLLEAGNGKLISLREYPAGNAADAQVFGQVLREVAQLYPAPSYGLAVFSHASGWMPEGTYSNPTLRSVVLDGSAEMSIPDMAAAIPDGMLDFVIFEACHMAGIEVAWELKEKTKLIVASSAELVSPGFLPVYAEAIPHLFKGDPGLEGFCLAVEADYRTRQDDYASLTLSLIDTQRLEAVGNALRGAGLPAPANGQQGFDRYGKDLFFDLYDAYAGLVPGKQAALQAAINGCVVWKSATERFMPAWGGFAVNTHSGLTTYIPQERYPKLNEAYEILKWHREVLE